MLLEDLLHPLRCSFDQAPAAFLHPVRECPSLEEVRVPGMAKMLLRVFGGQVAASLSHGCDLLQGQSLIGYLEITQEYLDPINDLVADRQLGKGKGQA